MNLKSTITYDKIKETVRDLCVKANTELRQDLLEAIKHLYEKEENENAKNMLRILLDNAEIARSEKLAICQDTGMAVIFIELGQDADISGGLLYDAVNEGVKTAYNEGYFRKSVVEDPILRNNTGTNTPAVIHTDIVAGHGIKITVLPKGFGSENKGAIKLFNPTATREEITDYCADIIKRAGPDACPPYVAGIGIGGTMDECAIAAKKALLRPVNSYNARQHIRVMEKEVESKARAAGIGIMGLGGDSTLLGANIEVLPTHIAGMPVAVNLSCHALRSAEGYIE